MNTKLFTSWLSEPSGLLSLENWKVVTAGALVCAGISFVAAATRKPPKERQLRVLIVGGTRGLGRQLAAQFALCGDRVVIAGRSAESRLSRLPLHVELGIKADVSNAVGVQTMIERSSAALGRIDVVICNAARTQSEKCPLGGAGVDAPTAAQLSEASDIIATNLTGSMLCAAASIGVMKDQGSGGHVFLMEGAGSGGRATAGSAAYGASKAGVTQLAHSLHQEVNRGKHGIGVHLLQPGMMITDLLMRSCLSASVARIFNVLAEPPATVSEWLVPGIRRIALQRSNRKAIAWGGAAECEGESELKQVLSGKSLRFLQPAGVIWRFMGYFMVKNRLIDEIKAPALVKGGGDWREAVTDEGLAAALGSSQAGVST